MSSLSSKLNSVLKYIFDLKSKLKTELNQIWLQNWPQNWLQILLAIWSQVYTTPQVWPQHYPKVMSKTFNILFILQWCNKPVSQAVGVAAMNRHPRDLPTEIMAIGWPTLRQSPWILSIVSLLSNIYEQSIMLLHTTLFWPHKKRPLNDLF